MIENFFTEERRIQGLINNAVNEEKQKSKKELERVQAENQKNEIIHLLKLEIPIEKITEITGYPRELINNIVSKEKQDN